MFLERRAFRGSPCLDGALFYPDFSTFFSENRTLSLIFDFKESHLT